MGMGQSRDKAIATRKASEPAALPEADVFSSNIPLEGDCNPSIVVLISCRAVTLSTILSSRRMGQAPRPLLLTRDPGAVGWSAITNRGIVTAYETGLEKDGAGAGHPK
jgi:hypothetical protein